MEQYQKLLDDFYLTEVVPRMDADLQALALDIRVLAHRQESRPITTLTELFVSEYWLIPWMVEELFPLTDTNRLYVAQGFALVFLGFIVLDNIIDRQAPDEALLPLVSHHLHQAAAEHFSRLFQVSTSFREAYHHHMRAFADTFALEYRCVVQHRERYTYEIMKTVDAGKASSYKIAIHALGALSRQEQHVSVVNGVYDLLTFADQFGDDAYDRFDDHRARRATLPVVLAADAEGRSIRDVLELHPDDFEDLLVKHGILLQMCDYGVEALRQAKRELDALGYGSTRLGQLLDLRIEQEQTRKQHFTAMSVFRGLSRRLVRGNSDTYNAHPHRS
jgi:hypothetical protein